MTPHSILTACQYLKEPSASIFRRDARLSLEMGGLYREVTNRKRDTTVLVVRATIKKRSDKGATFKIYLTRAPSLKRPLVRDFLEANL